MANICFLFTLQKNLIEKILKYFACLHGLIYKSSKISIIINGSGLLKF